MNTQTFEWHKLETEAYQKCIRLMDDLGHSDLANQIALRWGTDYQKKCLASNKVRVVDGESVNLGTAETAIAQTQRDTAEIAALRDVLQKSGETIFALNIAFKRIIEPGASDMIEDVMKEIESALAHTDNNQEKPNERT